jgi:large subunit ribosomal protein L23
MKRGWAFKKEISLSDVQACDTILRPVITEKATNVSANGCYVFEVPLGATKPEIKGAVEKLFKVKVKGVNTVTAKGKVKKFRGQLGVRSDRKKAYVTLQTGEAIDITAGI